MELCLLLLITASALSSNAFAPVAGGPVDGLTGGEEREPNCTKDQQGNIPVPVLYLQENIIEDEYTTIKCSLPDVDSKCLDVELAIRVNTTLQGCTHQGGNSPNISCTVKATQKMCDMDIICEAKFKTQSKPQKMNIQQKPSPANSGEMKEPRSAVILAVAVNLLTLILHLYYSY